MTPTNFTTIGQLTKYWENYLYHQPSVNRVVVKSYDFKITVTFTKNHSTQLVNILTVHE